MACAVAVSLLPKCGSYRQNTHCQVLWQVAALESRHLEFLAECVVLGDGVGGEPANLHSRAAAAAAKP